MMVYQRVRDIIPELIVATEKGQIKWKMMFDEPSDFYVTLNDHKIEVEFKTADNGVEEKQTTVCIYLWDSNANIIDSEYIGDKDPNFGQYYSYYKIVKNNALNVSAILQRIMDSLKLNN